jgi:hypothetical protein
MSNYAAGEELENEKTHNLIQEHDRVAEARKGEELL